jgi:hypothetical protein
MHDQRAGGGAVKRQLSGSKKTGELTIRSEIKECETSAFSPLRRGF